MTDPNIVHRLAAEDLAAAGYVVDLEEGVPPGDAAKALAAWQERHRLDELECHRCGHRYGLHDPDGCIQEMRDHEACACRGFLWINPEGPAPTYGDQAGLW